MASLIADLAAEKSAIKNNLHVSVHVHKSLKCGKGSSAHIHIVLRHIVNTQLPVYSCVCGLLYVLHIREMATNSSTKGPYLKELQGISQKSRYH